jgi:hypothetical protein
LANADPEDISRLPPRMLVHKKALNLLIITSLKILVILSLQPLRRIGVQMVYQKNSKAHGAKRKA